MINDNNILNSIARFAEDNNISYWNNLTRQISNMYINYIINNDVYIIKVTDYDDHNHIIFDYTLNKFNNEVDIYFYLTEKLNNLQHNIEDNNISFEEYSKQFKLKYHNCINLDSFLINGGVNYVCQYCVKQFILDDNDNYDDNIKKLLLNKNYKQYAFLIFTWLGCSCVCLESDGYPKEIVQFVLYCLKKYYNNQNSSQYIINHNDAIDFLNLQL